MSNVAHRTLVMGTVGAALGSIPAFVAPKQRGVHPPCHWVHPGWGCGRTSLGAAFRPHASMHQTQVFLASLLSLGPMLGVGVTDLLGKGTSKSA